jgi:putative ATP-dependent endonuclease of OLD family
MQLVNFSVTNYRSITKAHKINLQNITVLVGRNNEGKSNILMALNVAMETMMQHANHANVHERLYDWQRDFPVQLQQRKNNLDSVFRLNFRLNHDENTEFFRTTGIRSNEDIPIELKYGRDNRAKITVPKKGSSSFNDKSEKVTAFICERIAINYIQAVRTEDMAMDVIHKLISTELSKLYDNEEYKSAEQTIYNLQEAVYNDIANRILAPLQEFLPQLTNVEIRSRGRRLVWRGFRNDVDVILNDGTPTSILYKGDGIKSLVSLAILKESKNEIGASIIAIEEPESHLHPEAIHSLVNVIKGISENHQVIITTHNPLFVQRNNISNNIIVDHGTAKPAKNIKEIRELLGVLPEDNLINASHVLVVEGEDDKIALNKILSSLSPTIKDALIKNKLVIQPLAGATNLNYELSRLRSYVCRYFVFLDADEAGYDAAEKAIEKGLLSESDVKYSICNGNNTAEFEDCLKKDFYIEAIRNKFSVDLGVTSFRNSKKWSDRVKTVFLSQGQRWTDAVEKKVKMEVTKLIPVEDADSVLDEHKRGSIDALVNALENMLSQR